MVLDRKELVFFKHSTLVDDSTIDADAQTCRVLEQLDVFLRLWLRSAFAEKYKVVIPLCTIFFKHTMPSQCFSVAWLKLGISMLTSTE